MHRRGFTFLLFGLFISSALLPSCSRATPVWPSMPGKKRVLASFAPIYCFTQAVAGDDANVLCLLTSSGPHGAEMTPTDVLKLKGADLILSNGLGLDEKILENWLRSTKKEIPVVELGEAIDDKDLRHPEPDDHAKGHAKEKDHDHGKHDPHVWLDPRLAMVMVDKIAEELSKLDPSAKERFHKRAREYKAELDKMHKHGLARFKHKTNRNIVAQHDSLSYFADAFGLKVIGHLRTQAGDEGSIAEETELIKLCREKKPAVITIEPQFSGKKSQQLQKTLRREKIEVELVEVDPIETAPLAEGSANPDPGYYLKRMYENIENLDKALP